VAERGILEGNQPDANQKSSSEVIDAEESKGQKGIDEDKQATVPSQQPSE